MNAPTPQQDRQQPWGALLVRGGVDAARRVGGEWGHRAGGRPAGRRLDRGTPDAGDHRGSTPYDDAVTVLLNRPVPHRLRPAIGVGVVGRRAVLCVTPAGWRAVRRWLAWQPGRGVVHPPGLPVARLADVVGAAGQGDPGALGALADVLHDPAGDARSVVTDLFEVLGLPGGSYLDGGAAEVFGAAVVHPSPGVVRRFDEAVHDDVRWRDEMEGQQR